MRYGLQPLTKNKQENVRKKEEEDKYCHQEQWNVFVTEVLDICIIQPYPFIIVFILEVGERKCNNQCAKNLCV